MVKVRDFGKREKLFIVSEVFYPDTVSTSYILTEVAIHLSKRFDIIVICGPADYHDNHLYRTNELMNFEIHRIKTISLNKNKLFQRTLRFCFLTIQLSWLTLIKTRKEDRLLTVTNPAPMILMMGLITKLKRLRTSIVVHDVFPENLVPAKILNPNNVFYKLLRLFFNRAFSSATDLIVLGEDMELMMQNKISKYSTDTRISIIENWADNINVFPTNRIENVVLNQLNLQKKIVFQFAGNLGRVQGLKELIDIIAEANNSQIASLFIGQGAMRDEIGQYISNRTVKDIHLLPSFPRSEINIFLNACDIGIVTLTDGMAGLGVPSKSYNILAAGKPILYIGAKESAIFQLILKEDVGWAFEPKDRLGLLKFFSNISEEFKTSTFKKGVKAREVALSKFSKEIIFKKYDQLFF